MTENNKLTLAEAMGDFAGRVRRTMRPKDVSGYVEWKNGLAYLANADAWDELKQEFPMSRVTFEHHKHDDETVTVECMMIIEDTHNRYMGSTRLAVTDYKHNAIKNPNAVQIHNTEQRARTKCIFEMTGLGYEIYRGQFEVGELSKNQLFILNSLIQLYKIDVDLICKAYKVKAVEELNTGIFEKVINQIATKYGANNV